MFDKKIPGFEGTNALNLLHTILSSDNKSTLGRFASITERYSLQKGALVQLHQAATCALNESHEVEAKNDQKKEKQGHRINARADYIDKCSNKESSLIAIGEKGVLVDLDKSKNLLRKHERIKNIGDMKSTYKMEKLSFKWSGPTSLLNDKKHVNFKCGIVFEGRNVLAGLQTLVDKGVAKAPLPDFIKNAPMTSSGVITVNRTGSGLRDKE